MLVTFHDTLHHPSFLLQPDLAFSFIFLIYYLGHFYLLFSSAKHALSSWYTHPLQFLHHFFTFSFAIDLSSFCYSGCTPMFCLFATISMSLWLCLINSSILLHSCQESCILLCDLLNMFSFNFFLLLCLCLMHRCNSFLVSLLILSYVCLFASLYAFLMMFVTLKNSWTKAMFCPNCPVPTICSLFLLRTNLNHTYDLLHVWQCLSPLPLPSTLPALFEPCQFIWSMPKLLAVAPILWALLSLTVPCLCW